MSAYSRDDERAMQAGRLVNDWSQSGLLTPEQRDAILPGLQVDLRRTNLFLRLTLFVFTTLILLSIFGVMAIGIGSSEEAAAVLSLSGAVATFWLAWFLVAQYRLYRFGVEEAAAVTSISFTAVGVWLLAEVIREDGPGTVQRSAGLIAGAAAGLAVFLTFGYRYAALASMVCLCMLPFQIGDNEAAQRAVAAGLLGAIAVALRAKRAEHGDDHPGHTYAFLEAAAWVGIYILLNLQISPERSRIDSSSPFYWATFALIWILPAAGLWLGIRGRDRLLLDVSIAMALATLMSNKAYRGVEPNEWDPMVFGFFLMTAAIGLRQWLATGDNGERHGVTASRLLASDRGKIGVLGTVSVAHPGAHDHTTTDDSIGGGGRSGGAGASSKF
jgi:hypothetical protein